MKKYVSYIIIALSIVLMFTLSGCKPSRAVEKQTDAVSVQHLSYADSLRTDFSFLFDRLDMWVYDSLESDTNVAPHPTKIAKHIAVTNGSLTNSITDVKLKQAIDSASMTSQEVIRPVNVPPKLPTGFVVVAIIGLIFIIIASRTRN